MAEDKTEQVQNNEGDKKQESQEKEPVHENGTGDATEPAKAEEQPEPKKEMRAIVLTGFGGLKTVKVMKKPEPTLAEGEVLIRVKAW